MCKLRIHNLKHYKRLDYDWMNISDSHRFITIISVYDHLFEYSRAACCVNDKCPSKNVRRFEINLMAPNVQKDRLFERQLKKFIIDKDYYDTLLGFSLISCDACQHWGIEWTRIPQPYSVNPSTRNMDADFKAAQFATRYADRRY